MQINLKIEGLDSVKKQLANISKQVTYAASRALNTTAFAVNTEIKKEMQTAFKGGPTAFALRAFAVDKATKSSLTATIALREDAPSGGTSYSKALRHLFTSGTRDWKKLEGYLQAKRLMPAGLMAVPGDGCPLDSKGNIRKPALTEMLGVLSTQRANLRVYRKTGAGKAQKAVGYFVVTVGDKTRKHPGIYKRIETGTSSGISPMIMFVKRGNWRKYIDLQLVGNKVVGFEFEAAFTKEFEAAMASAR